MGITIVGGGPAGLYCASLLARRGERVTVYEEHARIGEPVQCTGIVTHEMEGFRELAEEIERATVRRVKTAHVYAPSWAKTTFRLTPNLILDRAKFDRSLERKAKKAGAIIRKGARVRVQGGCVITGDGKHRPKHLIGADGPDSAVRKSVSSRKIRYAVGTQALVRDSAIQEVHFFPYFGRYAWLVPEREGVVRAGVVCEKRPAELLRAFLRERGYTRQDVITYQAGLIPDYDAGLRMEYSRERQRVYLLGDAATQVKATTGGGVVPGLLSAECLAAAISEGKSYETLFKKRVGKSLRAHLLLRRALSCFKEKEYEALIRYVKRPRVKRIIEDGEREYPLRYLWQLALTEPRMMRFCVPPLRPGNLMRLITR